MDFEQRCAEALAEKFTRPTPRTVAGQELDGLIDPLPADRTGMSMSVEFVGKGGYQAFRAVTCAEVAAVCAAVRDAELKGAREEIEADDDAISALNGAVTRLEKSAAGWRAKALEVTEELEKYRRRFGPLS
jgi:hypothetical protein